MIVIDTSVIYALLDASDRRHAQARDWYATVDDELVTTPLVLAETDHLAAARGGPGAARAFRSDLGAGAYLIEWWSTAAGESAEVAERYADLGLGLTDASLVVLAARLDTTDIATYDERRFRVVRPIGAHDVFRLLPIDADR